MESSVQGHLAGWEIHGFYTMADLDIEKIKEEAGARWLRSNEIHAILCNYTYFNINVKPVNLPKGGTIVLFDRKVLRNFRKDGHNWKKKKDGKTVKEAHEHLKVGDQDRIHVYYAHGQDNSNFVRRIYWLLDKKHEHIVLVHYREVLEDTGNQFFAAPRECKEALSLSNRNPVGSPFASSHSSSGSRVLSEENESGLDCAFYDGSGTSVHTESAYVGTHLGNNPSAQAHELRLYEINTLDWDDLVDSNNSLESSQPAREEDLCSEQQSGYVLGNVCNNCSIDGSHNPDVFLGNPTNTPATISSVVKQPYNPPLSVSNNIDLQEKDDEMVNVGTDILLDSFGKELLQSQDSFGRWINYVQTDSQVPFDSRPIECPATVEHEGMPNSVNDKTSMYERIFTVTDYSPSWAFSTEETKVLVSGYFDEAWAQLANCNLFAVFGEKQVPLEKVQTGVFRCTAMPCSPGLVDFYVTLDGQTPISKPLSFEYKLNLPYVKGDGISSSEPEESKWDEFKVQARLSHLLFSTTNNNTILSGSISAGPLHEAKKFVARAPRYEKQWVAFMKSISRNELSIEQATRGLYELTLKNKLREWLLDKVFEGCKATARDSMGQGVIHLCAMLGYTWAVYPFSCSGLSLDFRDAFGWTALHWAAYCGREEMVAYLLSAGANPSLVTDPRADCPGGYTAADLAYMKGYDGLAAYLAEKGLTAHFKAMSISGNIKGSLETSEPVPLKPENVNDDELCMKDSLAAYRRAAEAAARIQAAFREQTLKLKTKAAQLEKTETEATHIVAALKIQHAFRDFNSRKRMAAAAIRIQHRFRTWKVRKDFLNMRRQAIRIQAAFKGLLVRRQYRKILWSVGVLEKAVLRWRLKRKGLRGIQADPVEAGVTEPQVNDVEDFYQISQKHAEERVERSVIRVQSMFRSHRAQKEYRRMKLACDQAKLEYDELLDPNVQ